MCMRISFLLGAVPTHVPTEILGIPPVCETACPFPEVKGKIVASFSYVLLVDIISGGTQRPLEGPALLEVRVVGGPHHASFKTLPKELKKLSIFFLKCICNLFIFFLFFNCLPWFQSNILLVAFFCKDPIQVPPCRESESQVS